MILNFILSLLFSIIHFVVNTLNNTAQGAMISMIPWFLVYIYYQR